VTQGHLWYSDDGVTFTHVSGMFTNTPTGLVYNEGDSLFYATTGPDTAGGVKSRVYTSPDAITWTLAFTVDGTTGWNFSRSVAEDGIDSSRAVVPMASLGGVTVASAQITTPDAEIVGGIVVGRNAGADWDFVAVEPADATRAGVSSSIVAVQALDNRIALLTPSAVAYSLRV
jgi:hypothetical protein